MDAVAKKSPRPTAKRRRIKSDTLVMADTKADAVARAKTVHFGSASLKVDPAARKAWAANVAVGQAALKKIKTRLTKPGVRLRTKKTTPLFHADPARPGRLIRDLDGKKESGVIEGGVFKPLP